MISLRKVASYLNLYKVENRYFGIVSTSKIEISENRNAVNILFEVPNMNSVDVLPLCNKLKYIYAKKVLYFEKIMHISLDLNNKDYRITTNEEIIEYIKYCATIIGSSIQNRSDYCEFCRNNKNIYYYTLNGKGFIVCENCKDQFEKKSSKMEYEYKHDHRSYILGGIIGNLFGIIFIVIASRFSKYLLNISWYLLLFTPIITFAGYNLIEKEKGRHTSIVFIVNNFINIVFLFILLLGFNKISILDYIYQINIDEKINRFIIVTLLVLLISSIITYFRIFNSIYFRGIKLAKKV
jgi:hypothetical protein